jgi:hypothetical protein
MLFSGSQTLIPGFTYKPVDGGYEFPAGLYGYEGSPASPTPNIY